MLSNSLVAGALATCYVLVLVLQLNPTLPLEPRRLVPLVATVGLFYAVHLIGDRSTCCSSCGSCWRASCSRRRGSASACWRGSARSPRRPASALMWANLRTFALVLEPETIDGDDAGRDRPGGVVGAVPADRRCCQRYGGRARRCGPAWLALIVAGVRWRAARAARTRRRAAARGAAARRGRSTCRRRARRRA